MKLLKVMFKITSLRAEMFIGHELTVMFIGHGLKIRLWREILSLGLTNLPQTALVDTCE
jgi:hypothetical protein